MEQMSHSQYEAQSTEVVKPPEAVQPLEEDPQPIDFTKDNENLSPDSPKFMERISTYLQKLPGGKYILPAIAISQMVSGGIAQGAEKNAARDKLAYKDYIEQILPLSIAGAFRSGVEIQPDGNVIIDKTKFPSTNDKNGDIWYSNQFSGRFFKQDMVKTIEADNAKFIKEITAICGDHKDLAKTILTQYDTMVKKTWPEGLNGNAMIHVNREGNDYVPAHYATYGEDLNAAYEPIKNALDSIIHEGLDNDTRAKLTTNMLYQSGDIISEAVESNMRRVSTE